jgi:large subunit ribosomal protein L6
MSRIGKKPVAVPANVKVALSGCAVTVEGPLGKLQYEHRPEVSVAFDEAARRLVVSRRGDERAARAFHGLTRALLANMVEGVTKGYRKSLEIVGVGYSAKLQGQVLVLNIGFAHPVVMPIPEGLKVELPSATQVVIKGADKQLVGEFAAEVRAVRKPEPYQGKGIRYSGEVVRRKAGKAFAGTAST